MSGINSYRDLEVWQLSMSFAEDVYRVVKTFPADERYALADQLRRAVVSVPSNIAEGFGRESPKDFARFLTTARGSLFEAMTQLELAARLGYMASGSGLYDRAVRISKMLVSLLSKVREWHPPKNKLNVIKNCLQSDSLNVLAHNQEPGTKNQEPFS